MCYKYALIRLSDENPRRESKMKICLVGLPLAGKSSLFSALTGQAAASASTRGAEQVAVVKVPDDRIVLLTEVFKPRKRTPASIEFSEIAGVEAGEAKGHGLSEQFLARLRAADALLCVIRAFSDPAVPHPLKSIDPARDLRLLEAEFLLSDLAIIEGRQERLVKQMAAKRSDRDVRELEVLRRCRELLESETPLRRAELKSEEEILLRGFRFLTLKPIIVAVNLGEDDIGREAEALAPFAPWMELEKTAIIGLSARLEMELRQFPEDEARALLADFGLADTALSRLIATSFRLLGLASFFTVGSDEVKAWTIREGTRAAQAAGVIHSDIERGFIRAEVVPFEAFAECRSLPECRTAGSLRLEGKDYPVRDGDIINFRFAV
jgi:ribosome-binding ATPase